MIALPGEAYSYSNLMFAAGGYAAAQTVAANNSDDLHRTYTTLMQERIFDPIGMAHTTFDFDAAIANNNHASPHAFDVVESDLDVLPIDWERFIVPVAPAGASWSNVEDMALYLTTHLNQGVAPNGTVVVSVANLSETQQAGINIAGDIYYGMGWVIDAYNGLPLLWHSGGTQGFASDIAFLPEANLGVVVLSNKGNADNFTRSVREYVFELGFNLEHEADSRYRATQAATDAALEAILLENQFVPVEQEQAIPYVGEYDMGLSVLYDESNGFVLDTAYGEVSLVVVVGREGTFYAQNGLILTFSNDSEDGVTLSIGLLDDPLQTVVLQKIKG
jgi:CubicO group peptidase (beta-lactamase class C family)